MYTYNQNHYQNRKSFYRITLQHHHHHRSSQFISIVHRLCSFFLSLAKVRLDYSLANGTSAHFKFSSSSITSCDVYPYHTNLSEFHHFILVRDFQVTLCQSRSTPVGTTKPDGKSDLQLIHSMLQEKKNRLLQATLQIIENFLLVRQGAIAPRRRIKFTVVLESVIKITRRKSNKFYHEQLQQ